ncbi:hypothetical protein [Mucilaginibacter agri]|uniref:Lipoprotein n=1 Tax=Mucilaginibacter agri TaxID=2695265 RepID=A0A965ZJI0_9SPHI|nr:hypothetical protein [Mucilaginibacter agri]NCD72285.1 hypothetical protein [Mucilaginibacter agri]
MKKIYNRIKKLPFLILFFLASLFLSCGKDVKSEKEVYSNDFESGDLKNIDGGLLTTFNKTKVLGRYNTGGFSLTVPNLPKHDLIEVSFDLYIHDTWEGNSIQESFAGPDMWTMSIDGNPYINTTFSNSDCIAGNFCPPQSYPDNYLNSYNNPKTGAFRTTLPGACALASSPKGTTQYKIVKQVAHSGSTVTLQCLAKLIQTNVSDVLCDESWSVDNIKIKVIAL